MTGAVLGEINGVAYSASKFGLIGFPQSSYGDVRKCDIGVVVI
jgi:hypothetical protein